MSFLRELVDDFTGGNNNRQDRPDCPRPWQAEWDHRSDRWVFVNQETGERTFDIPVSEEVSGWAGRKVGEAERFDDGVRNDYDDARDDVRRDERRFDNGVRRDERRFENGVERRWDDGVQDVENVPQDISYGVGEGIGKVERFGQDVEDIPQDARQGFDRFEDRIAGGFNRFVDGVEDIPQDVSHEAGRIDGDVDRYGREQQNAFDAGRNEERYEGRNDRW